jgi:pilus assembly protein CpaE
MPRLFDPVFVEVVDEADRFILVMQQSIAHIRDTKRLLNILRVDMNVPESRLMVVVNRYTNRTAMMVKDLSEALNFGPLVTLPNDYQNVAQSTNVGRPLLDFAPNAEIVGNLRTMTEALTGKARKREKSLLQRWMRFRD